MSTAIITRPVFCHPVNEVSAEVVEVKAVSPRRAAIKEKFSAAAKFTGGLVSDVVGGVADTLEDVNKHAKKGFGAGLGATGGVVAACVLIDAIGEILPS